MNPGFPPNPATGGPFSQIDLEQMPEAPNRGSYHRRAHSDTFFRLPDDLLFDVDFSSLGLPPNTNSAINSSRTNQLDTPMALDSCRPEDSGHNFKTVGTTGKPPPPIGHFRSLSVDASADFFEGMLFDTAMCDDRDSGGKSADAPSASEGRRLGLHRRNNSMDRTSSSFEADSFVDGVKKVMTADKLAQLALLDPKRAQKILANRQSAARSKERKVRYTGELERKVQTLQTEATTLSTQVTMLQRDTSGLTSENRELKLRLQAMEQQAHLKDALNETLREEVQRLRITASQNPSPKSNAPNRSSNPFSIQQGHPQPSNNEQNSVKQLWPSFLDFNHRV